MEWEDADPFQRPVLSLIQDCRRAAGAESISPPQLWIAGVPAGARAPSEAPGFIFRP